jgi:hypothetical protein
MPDVALRAVSQADLAFLDRLDSDPTALGEFEWPGFHSPARLRKEWEANGLLSAASSRLVVTDADAVTGFVSWRTTAGSGSFCDLRRRDRAYKIRLRCPPLSTGPERGIIHPRLHETLGLRYTA